MGLRTFGVRVSDKKTVPLCKFHHDELHACGREELYWAMRGIDPMEWINEFLGSPSD